MKNYFLVGVILMATAIGAASAATFGECAMRCSSCGNDPVCDAQHETCMQNCMRSAPGRPAPVQADVWGAIAVSPTTLLHGHSYNYLSEEEAARMAVEDCHEKGPRDCKVAVTVADVCVALATSKPEHIYRIGGPTGNVTVASGNGMLMCQRAGGRSCYIDLTFCADGINHK
jgi:Domain of unknown function (DUF4189)